MSFAISIDKLGRLVLPKEIRTRLNLSPGDILDAEVLSDEVLLRPRRIATACVARVGKRAIWDAPGSSATLEQIEQTLQRGRSERDTRNHGL